MRKRLTVAVGGLFQESETIADDRNVVAGMKDNPAGKSD
jgi:hypothetical protein